MYKCRYCSKEYDNHLKLAGHVTHCSLNPNRDANYKKNGDSRKVSRVTLKMNCLKCGVEFEIVETQHNIDKGSHKKHCSRSCANSRTHSEETKGKIRNTLLDKIPMERKKSTTKYGSKLKRRCSFCGDFIHSRPNVCKRKQLIPTLVKYFNFDLTSLGSFDAYDEFDRIYNMLEKDYWVDKLSIPDMVEKYGHYDYRNFNKILNSIGILKRNTSESLVNASLMGKTEPGVSKHKFSSLQQWHTTWDGKKVFLRSSYELEYAQELDSKKIKYEVESLRLLYWDSQKEMERVAIPDFYIPDDNLIVEIKGSYYYDEINMIDKVKIYKDNGYSFKLIMDKDEYDLKY